MQPFRQIIRDAPEFLAVPFGLQHKRIEVIIWPLEDGESDTPSQSPQYLRADVDNITVLPRDERNVR